MRATIVNCPECKTESDSNKVKFVDISEDIMGHDLMKFVCPKCEKTVESNVRVK